jgi:hypothetical protein
MAASSDPRRQNSIQDDRHGQEYRDDSLSLGEETLLDDCGGMGYACLGCSKGESHECECSGGGEEGHQNDIRGKEEAPEPCHHALKCQDINCEPCRIRQPGIELLRTRRVKEELSYTQGYPAEARTYVKGKNLVVIVPTEETVKLMQASAEAGRSFRDLKRRLDPKLEQLDVELEVASQQAIVCYSRLNDAIKILTNNSENENNEAYIQLKACWEKHQEAPDNHNKLKEDYNDLRGQLRRAEAVWLEPMRRLSDQGDSILVDAGLFEWLEESE